jgi:vitamin K-dependent gamma-carboxylase
MLISNEPTSSTREVLEGHRGDQPSFLNRLFAVVDASSMVFFRVVFGGLLAAWAWDYLDSGRVKSLYIDPAFHFTYAGFEWVRPWPGNGMLLHFAVMFVLAIFISIGFFYRIASLLFTLGFTYFFLLDRTNYQNHYYLIGLLAWWLPWMPLNRFVSVDTWLWPTENSNIVPMWTVWIVRFHTALPYFFGGIAKINMDWLQGQPIAQMLSAKSSLPIIGGLLANESTAYLLAWVAMVFDLCIVPLLLWKRTRLAAYGLCILFHLMNAIVFDIHVFPWFMIAATPIFFAPDWPRQLLGGVALDLQGIRSSDIALTTQRRIGLVFMVAYILFHCVWPLRHLAYPGDASWNEQGHYFAWRMMLRGKSVVLGYAVKDQLNGKVVDGKINRFINSEQSDKFSRDPEMILQLAHFLGDHYRQSTGNAASVYALVLASLNGRKPELLIDPNVDLMKESRGFGNRDWILEQKEPLRKPAWSLPPEKWREHVQIPELKFLVKSNSSGGGESSQSPNLAELN